MRREKPHSGFFTYFPKASEAACYLGLLNVAAPKLVLAGDHKQLPPMVHSSYSPRQLQLSLMERLIGEWRPQAAASCGILPSFISKLQKGYS